MKQKFKNIINSYWLLIILILLNLFFVFMHQRTRLDYYFNLDFEYNLPTFYQAIQLYTVFILSIIFIYFSKIFHKSRDKAIKFFWICFASVSLYLSFDEAVEIHEKIFENLKIYFGEETINNFIFSTLVEKSIYSPWLILYFPILILGILIFLLISKSLIKTYKRQILLLLFATITLFLNSFLMEYIQTQPGHSYETYNNLVRLEEFSEMLGATFLVWFVFINIKKLKLKSS